MKVEAKFPANPRPESFEILLSASEARLLRHFLGCAQIKDCAVLDKASQFARSLVAGLDKENVEV